MIREIRYLIYLFCVVIVLERVQSQFFIHHHCYMEGGGCGKEYITCSNDTIIDVVWCRIGYSENWQWDGTRTNCSVTDSTCYKELDESAHNCSGLTECELDTCSDRMYQVLDCTHPDATNFMRINYTCFEVTTTRIRAASSTSGMKQHETTFIIIISVVGVVVINTVSEESVVVVQRRKKKNREAFKDENKDVSDDVDQPLIDYLDIDTLNVK